MDTISKVERLIQQIDRIVAVLKKRFPNLTTGEALSLAGQIMLAIEREPDAG